MIVRLKLETLSIDGQAPDQVPTEFRLFKLGQNRAYHIGRGESQILFDEQAANRVMNAYRSDGIDRIAIDSEHQTFAAAENGKPAPAYGWFIPEVRADGLYASDVKWTDEGKALIASKAYRFFSPTCEVEMDKEGNCRPVRLLPAALTNLPALRDIQPLMAARADTDTTSKESPKMKLLLAALGCKEDADEPTALGAFEQFKDAYANLLALSGKGTLVEAAATLKDWKAKAEQFTVLSTELETLRAEKAKAELDGLIDGAVKDGRLAPAKKDQMLELAQKFGLDGVKAFLSMLPKVPAPAEEPKVEPKQEGASVPEVLTREFGLKPGAFSGKISPSLPTSSKREDGKEMIAHVFGVKPEALNSPAPSLPIGRGDVY